ncbi:MAG: efflux RND transporter periplasmic adaptor subunit [Bacteroidaceae bacterium]|nr:efflux RND transporter periplasmic adaptor subunit [Bacteroidaceae bacterium]
MAKNKSELGLILRPIIFITIVILAVGLIGYFTLGHDSETIQGQVEVSQYRVSGKVPGRIDALYVQEGQTVHAGDTLVRLDAPEVWAKLDQARSAEEAAQALSDKARRGTRQEQIQSALELWKKSQAGVTIAEKTFTRIKHLYDEGVVPAQRLDEATAQRDAAIATEKAAAAQYQMALNGAQREDKAAAQAQVARAQGAVSEVESYLQETVLTAPADGEVSEIFPKLGELVGQGSPIMNVSMLDDLWITFNVREDLLCDLSMGAVVTGFVPALNNKEFSMKVYYLKDLGTYATWKATKSTGQYDLKTFEVKARPEVPVEGLRPGMTVVLRR